MAIAKIVVPVTGSSRDGAALVTAFEAAKPFGAHVEALFVHRDPREAVGYPELTLRPEIVQNLVDTAELLAKEAGQAANRAFAAAAAGAEVEVVETPQRAGEATASYREVTGHPSRVLAAEAALSDLVVFPPIGHKDDPEIHDAFVRVLAETGRPVLLAPEDPPQHIGRRIVVGWDGRAAAAKALLSALPFLDKASAVEILSVQRSPGDNHGIDDARDYLALHGIGCSERVIEPGKRSIAGALLDAAKGSDCDLLVVGGYGHSRLAESVFGGVTASIVSYPKLPIFMVH